MARGLLVTDGVQLSRRGKRILAHELVGLIERALLGSKGEGDIAHLTRDEPRCGMPVSRGEMDSPAQVPSAPMHIAWAINRRSWKPLCSRTAMAWLPSQKCGGTARMTGMLSWMAARSSGKTGQQGEVVELLSI